ncbi:uncharacterized protein J7T54_001527 [Emericellopsis cladophorae]|uniref:Arrestin-like N-terminal domain-containing protein n=1 Tax=Emericellopsis cladophorae TaxID=2686198 RepID=A0A9P9XUM0_9HYPO|nr:uncharacterized protein J7T54_001527 [Emericellopsis cladophorae]KAI6778107.1 hypothetical protein J7T54_001527 [Emericellopsis cladophorae]
MARDTRFWTTSSSHGPIHSSLTFTVESGILSNLDATSECRLRPGDALHGTYRITTELAMGGRWVEVSLQGHESVLIRRAISSRDSVYRDQFGAERVESSLHSYVLFLDDGYAVEDGQRVYTASFVLVVPAGLDRTSDRAQDECKPLPPSFHIQRSAFRTWSPTVPPNVFISYSLRASVAYCFPSGDDSPDATKSAEIVYPVTCLPYIEAQPPIETSCFPDEYVLSASQTAWRWLLGQNLGRITFKVREPPPLIYDNSEQLSTTHFTMWITFNGHPSHLHRLRAGSIKVDPVLQTRTYYSGTKLTVNPGRESVQASGRIQLHTNVIQLDVQSFSSLQWSTRDVRRGSTVTAAPATTAEEEGPPWCVAVNIPIKPPLKLPPSFCSDYAASSYAIIAKVSISGVHAKPSYVMFPLQVAYPSSAQKAPVSVRRAADSRGLTPPLFLSSPEDNVCCTAVDADVQHENDLLPPLYAA